MGEVYSWYEQEEVEKNGIDQKLNELASWQEWEKVVMYPKTPEQVRQSFQNIATELQAEISQNRSSTESNNDRRWQFEVKSDSASGAYCYLMKSYGINTKFRFVPTWWNSGKGRLSLYYGIANTEYISVNISNLEDVRGIKKFLGWVNSANKEIALCEDYQFLEDLPDLLNNKHNEKYYTSYKQRYNKIMKESSFKNLKFETSSWGSWSLIDTFMWKKDEFMDARRSAIKEKKRWQLDTLFATKMRGA